MEKKISLKGSFSTDWIRYSEYEYKTAEDGSTYIIPSRDAVFSMYNPFDVAQELLMDLMKIGDMAIKLEGDSNKNFETLKKPLMIFVRKYGLLGLISASAYNRNIIGEKNILMIENNHITKKEIINAEEYVNMFIPFINEGDIKIGEYKNKVYLAKSEDSPSFYGKRPVVMDLIFSMFYSEKIDWIIDFAKLIVKHFNQLLMFRNSLNYLIENVTIMAGQFHAEKIGFTINQLDKTFIAWQFDSLKTAIETIYAFAVTDEKIILNRCSNCKEIFIAKSDREKYCNTSCRNRANVRKSRNKKSSSKKEN
ncbi:CGNR zinc finger domain-containing protein [Clostridiaceae bacterium M8S5]|nr:CGNR zinc finger domain-containing protein [Clostridiaceae bacterium M8S5]